MDERLLTLQLFCSNLRFSISSGKTVQGGIQYEVTNGSDVVYVTLYNSGRCFARGPFHPANTALIRPNPINVTILLLDPSTYNSILTTDP